MFAADGARKRTLHARCRRLPRRRVRGAQERLRLARGEELGVRGVGEEGKRQPTLQPRGPPSERWHGDRYM